VYTIVRALENLLGVWVFSVENLLRVWVFSVWSAVGRGSCHDAYTKGLPRVEAG
jgi:hypothetical protein